MIDQTSPSTPPRPTAVVTGAGSGIGHATALRLAKDGYRVAILGRHLENLEQTLSALPGDDHRALACDLVIPEEVTAAFASLKAEFASIDAIAHCAGIHWLRPIQNTSPAQLDEMFNSHVRSALLILRELIKQRLFAPKDASVVFVSSAAALQGGASTFAYSAAKGAIISAARTAAMELARRGVRVNVVVPGVVDTPQSRKFLSQLPDEQQEAIRQSHPLGIGMPDDVADAIAFLLSRQARWITGTTLAVDGGLMARS